MRGLMRGLIMVLACALGATPLPVRAQPPPLEPADEPARVDEPDPTEPEPTEPEPTEPEPTEPEPEFERGSIPSGGGMVGAIVDPNDPNASRAQSDLEGEGLDAEAAGVPDRLPKLQAAGWWTTFTAVALATTGGIFAGVAETREDEARRLAHSFDLTTGRTTLYGPVAEDYERLLAEGHAYQWVARGFLIAGGVALIAGVTTFTVDGVRRRRAGRDTAARVRLDPHAGGLRLRF
jgi:hypothetical protein